MADQVDPAVAEIQKQLLEDEDLAGHAQTSNLVGYRYRFDPTFVDALARMRNEHPDFFERTLADREFRDDLVANLRASVYNRQRTS